MVVEQHKMKDVVGLVCLAIPGWVEIEQEIVKENFAIIIQSVRQFQARMLELEARQMPGTLQEVQDQRAESIRNFIANLKALAMECKHLSTTSAQHYAKLSEDPMLKREEAQLQDALQQSYSLQAQMNVLPTLERMKRASEQCAMQQQVIDLQNKVNETTQRIQLV